MGVSSSSIARAISSHMLANSSGRSAPTSTTATAAGANPLPTARARPSLGETSSAASCRESALPMSPATTNSPTDAPSSNGSASKNGRTMASVRTM